jgi:hypothetical protein
MTLKKEEEEATGIVFVHALYALTLVCTCEANRHSRPRQCRRLYTPHPLLP